jgi:RNA polymerase sigma-70 factor (ECF subfamily)
LAGVGGWHTEGMSGPDPLDDALASMRSGDGDAFRVVYRAVQAPLLRYLEVLVGPNEAEDVASETWGQACRDLDRFEGDADGFRGWITTIGRHRALDLLRQRSRRIRADQDVDEVDLPGSADLEVAMLEGFSTRAAIALIRSLPRDQAEAVMLRAVMGLDARSAGAVLGKRPGAVRSAAHRGLATLARRLESRPASLVEVRDTFVPPGAEGVR